VINLVPVNFLYWLQSRNTFPIQLISTSDPSAGTKQGQIPPRLYFLCHYRGRVNSRKARWDQEGKFPRHTCATTIEEMEVGWTPRRCKGCEVVEKSAWLHQPQIYVRGQSSKAAKCTGTSLSGKRSDKSPGPGSKQINLCWGRWNSKASWYTSNISFPVWKRRSCLEDRQTSLSPCTFNPCEKKGNLACSPSTYSGNNYSFSI